MRKEKLLDTAAPTSEVEAAYETVEITSDLRIVIFVLGRGSRGKSLLVRWLIELLREKGLNVIIADGDRTNPTLKAFHTDAVSPTSPEDAVVNKWTYDLLETTALLPHGAVLLFDFGGGDQVLKKIMFELPLDEFLTEDLGFRTIALHLVGSDVDDLAYIRACEEGNRFTPKRTAVILNEAIIPEHLPFGDVNRAVEESDLVKTIGERGGLYLTMPVLKPAMEINEKRLTFAEALVGKGVPPLGPTARRLTRVWKEQMLESLQPILDWILK